MQNVVLLINAKATLICHRDGGTVAVAFDVEDLPLVEPHRWNLGCGANGRFYASTKIDGHTAYLHRLIARCPPDLEVDHVDGDPLNNRRGNLRCVTHQMNQANRTRATKRARSALRGVETHFAGGFVARAQFAGVRHYLGYFADAADAAAVVREFWTSRGFAY